MATINHYTYSLQTGSRKIRYVLEKRLPDDPVRGEYCSHDPDTVVQEFTDLCSSHNSKCEKPIAEMIHSFSPEESKLVTPELVNKLGHEVVSTMYPGHQALVVTHLDRGHYHNHILMNRHHFETGKLSRDNFTNLKALRTVCNDVSLKYGLSVLGQDKKEREAKMPKAVADMIKHSRFSYVADMMQKADLARSLATNYSQYQSILFEFGIEARVEKKNIAYFYPGKDIPKRGKSMGALYDKAGLERAFKENDEKFQKNPKVRSLMSQGLDDVKNSGVLISKAVDSLSAQTDGHIKSGVKDYAKHHVVPRREARWARASEDELRDAEVPLDEIRRAKRENIIDYCRSKRIGLEYIKDDLYQMKGRPYVEISPHEWRNTKNNTRGSIIDLVAAHKRMTFLEAVAEINGNKRLLFLQKEIGPVKRTATSFYIPRAERDESPTAIQHLGDLLSHKGIPQASSSDLIKSNQVHVSKSGIVRLFSQRDEHSAIEYSKDNAGVWQRTTKGDITKPFKTLNGSGTKATVFLDPFSFIKSHGSRSLKNTESDRHSLVLMEPNHKLVDQFLAGNKAVTSLELVTEHNKKPTQMELDFFSNLKTRYQSLGISMDLVPNQDRSRGLGLGLER